ncbi:MAG: PfkB family carbohydrate kinase [Pseudomonadota bacterium]
MAKSSILCVGHAVEDHVFTVPATPTAPQKYAAHGFSVVGGGPAANAAVAAARLGGVVRLAARVGKDAVGASIIADLEAEGVDCNYVRRIPGAVSSVSAVMIADDGERMIVNYRDPDLPADAAWTAEALDADIGAVLADSRWPEGAAIAMEAARQRGAPGVLDADRPFPRDDAAMQTALNAASHVAFSADGLRDFVGDDGADLQDALSGAVDRLGGFVCVTDGAAGVLAADDGRLRSVPGFRVAAVDTLGAGDVWHGAFALALAEGSDAINAARFANAAAALKCTRPGGRAGAPARAEVDAYLSQTQELEASF